MIIAVNQNLMRSKYAIVKWKNAYALMLSEKAEYQVTTYLWLKLCKICTHKGKHWRELQKNDSRLNQVMVLCMDNYFPLFQNFLQCYSIIFSNKIATHQKSNYPKSVAENRRKYLSDSWKCRYFLSFEAKEKSCKGSGTQVWWNKT